MIRRSLLSGPGLVIALAGAAAPAYAQNAQVIEIPNEMGIHTWFIIVAIGSLLAWGISYSIDLHQERTERRKSREFLAEQRRKLLIEIVDLDELREAGKVSDSAHRTRSKELRRQLAHVTTRLSSKAPGPA